MDYEKKYKEALERAKDYHKQLIDEDNSEWAGEIENIFPELQESEDERIRKALMWFVERFPYDRLDNNGVSVKEALAWLEKQGEQKPTIEMKSAEESLGIDSATYNKIVDEVIYGEQKDFAPQVDGFDAELNALLKKYEHLSKEELQEPLEFYLGVVRDDLDIVREEKQ